MLWLRGNFLLERRIFIISTSNIHPQSGRPKVSVLNERRFVARAPKELKLVSGGEALGVRKLACALAREASFAHLKRQQAAALQIQSSLPVGNTMGGLDAERATDYTNKGDIVPSPLPGLLIFLLFNPGVAHCFAALHPRLIWSDRVKC
jgi:hypothetical protein